MRVRVRIRVRVRVRVTLTLTLTLSALGLHRGHVLGRGHGRALLRHEHAEHRRHGLVVLVRVRGRG